MKELYKIFSRLVLFVTAIFLFSCSKQQEFYPQNHIIDIKINGYIAKDSLQFKLGDKLIKPGSNEQGDYFKGAVNIMQNYNGPVAFSILNSKGEQILSKKIDGSSISNPVNFYYDGTSIIDKLPEIPKASPGNVGILLNFPERKFSKALLKDIIVEMTIAKRGQPTIMKRYPFNEDGTVFIDINIPPIYQSIAFKLMKADNPSERYVPGVSTNFIMNSPKANNNYLILIQESTDEAGNFSWVEGIELTQYLK